MVNLDYANIVKKSFNLAIRHRWLWVYGLILASFGGSFGNFSNFNSSSSSFRLPQVKDLPEKSDKVLGAATDAISYWFSTISPAVWLALILVFVVTVIISMLLYWIIKSWAKAGLIAGLADAENGQIVTLANSSQKGLKTFKNIMLYEVWVFALVILGILALIGTSIPIIGLSMFVPILGALVGVIVFFCGIIVFIIAGVLLSITSIYAERLIVLHGYSAKTAFKQGFSLARKHGVPVVIMGIINTAIGCGFGCITGLLTMLIFIPILIFSLIAYPGILADINNNPVRLLTYIPLLGGLGIFIAIFITTLLNFLNGINIIFRYATWNELFKEIIKLEPNI